MGKAPLRLRVFLSTFVSSMIPLILATTILHMNFIHTFKQQLGNQAMDIATLASNREDIRKAYELPSPSYILQPIGEEIRAHTQVAFVIFLDQDGRRLSHPNESLIGLLFTGGDEKPALQGKTYISYATGISGASIRAFHPIYNTRNEQVGTVVVGFYEPTTSVILSTINNTFYVVTPLSLILIASELAMSKITIWRYLEYLVEEKKPNFNYPSSKPFLTF